MSDAGFWEIAPNVVTAGAAVAAVLYARSGLNTWRKQLKGTADFELAHSLLSKTYQLRDSIDKLRAHFMPTAEISEDDPAVKNLTPQERDHLAFQRGLEARWSLVQESGRGMEPLLVEAESLWGHEAREKFNALFKVTHDLRFAINMYLRANNPSIPEQLRQKALDWNADRKIDEIIFDHSSRDNPDEFNKKLEQAIKPVENELRPHLNRDGGIE